MVIACAIDDKMNFLLVIRISFTDFIEKSNNIVVVDRLVIIKDSSTDITQI